MSYWDLQVKCTSLSSQSPIYTLKKLVFNWEVEMRKIYEIEYLRMSQKRMYCMHNFTHARVCLFLLFSTSFFFFQYSIGRIHLFHISACPRDIPSAGALNH